MKLIKISLTTICLSAVVFASCKKTQNTPSVHDKITGKWMITSIYIDTNKNGAMDANEMHTDTSYAHTIITFNADGSGTQTYYAQVSSQISWTLADNDTYMQLTPPGQTNVEHLHIDQLTTTAMILKDSTATQVSWVVYSKQ